MPEQSLLKLETEIWNALEMATKDSKNPFKIVSLSTINVTNTPESRMVILRNVSKNLKILEIFTDIRSKKYNEILSNPSVSCLFYDPIQQIQIRIIGNAEIYNLKKNSLAIFNRLSKQSKRLYGLEFPPGKPGKMNIQGVSPYNEKDAIKNFCLIRVHSLELDYLQLAKPFHKRAIIKYGQNGKHTSSWVMP